EARCQPTGSGARGGSRAGVGGAGGRSRASTGRAPGGGGRARERSSWPTGSGGIGGAERAQRASTGRAPGGGGRARERSSWPTGRVVGAGPARAAAHDVLIGATGLRELPPGARVGTASVRRRAQLLARRPDLAVTPLRGNVDTRLRRWREGAIDALVLAAAGLERLGIAEPAAHALAPEEFLPPVGQGALALECRADAAPTRALL